MAEKFLWIESLERLMEKDAEQRAAFLDLLRAIKNDPTWRLLITCRDYSAETVRSAFFGEVGIPCADIFVPELSDAELDEVTADFPILQRPMSSDALRRLLRHHSCWIKPCKCSGQRQSRFQRMSASFGKKFGGMLFAARTKASRLGCHDCVATFWLKWHYAVQKP